MNYYAAKTKQSETHQSEGAYHPKYGPRVNWNGKQITLTGTIVLYGNTSNVDIADVHFRNAIAAWNKPAVPLQNTPIAPDGQPHREGLPGSIIMNGRRVYVTLDLKVEKKTMDEVELALQRPKPDHVYILVGEDDFGDYNSTTAVNNRTLPISQNDGTYYNSIVNPRPPLVMNPLANPGRSWLQNLLNGGFSPGSFIIGNMGFYDLAQSQSRGNTTAAHELGHWLSHQFLSPTGNWTSHAIINPNQARPPIKTFWAEHQPIMSGDVQMPMRHPLVSEVANIGYNGVDFNIYQNTQARPNGGYLGDRTPNGQLILFNNTTMFKTPTQASMFSSLFGNIPDWDPRTGILPQ